MVTPSPFLRLRTVILECLQVMGAIGDPDADMEGIAVRFKSRAPVEIPFFHKPELDSLEQVVVEALERAAGPLQQKEIAKAAGISSRLVQRVTPELVRRHIIAKHPSQGFFLPGRHHPGEN